MARRLGLLLVLVGCSAFGGTFVSGNTSLPALKTDANPPTGSSSELDAADINNAYSDLGDLRTHVYGWVNVQDNGVKCDGSTDDTQAVVAAASDAVTKGYGLYVPCRTRIATSGTTSLGVAVQFGDGGSFDILTGATLTLTNGLTAGLHQIFFLDGGSLTFQAKVRAVRAEWFGLKADNTTDDTAALQAAVNAAGTSTYLVELPAKGIKITTTVHLVPVLDGQGVTIQGRGNRITTLNWSGNTTSDCVDFDNSSGSNYVRGGGLRDLHINGACRDSVELLETSQTHIKDCDFDGATRYGIHASGISALNLDNVKSFQPGTSALVVDTGKFVSTSVRANSFYASGVVTGPAIDVSATDTVLVKPIIESTGGGLLANAASGEGIRCELRTCTIIAPYIENSTGHDIHLGSDSTGGHLGKYTIVGGYFDDSGGYKQATCGSYNCAAIFVERAKNAIITNPFFTNVTAGNEVIRATSGTNAGGINTNVTTYGVYRYGVTWDPPSVANGAVTTFLINPTTGTKVGDRVLVSCDQALPAGVFLFGSVPADGQVTIGVFNESGGAVDLSSGVFYVDEEMR